MAARATAKKPVSDRSAAKAPVGSLARAPLAEMPGYPGSKNGAGVAERIIGQMPPHDEYIEGFAGSAAVFRRKAPCKKSWLIDIDPKTCQQLGSTLGGYAGVDVVCASFLDWIKTYRWSVRPSTLIYLDSPYLQDVRSRTLYDFEFNAPKQHKELLELMRKLPCMVMATHYYALLWHNQLFDWRRVEIPTMTHGGKRIEVLWCNFEAPQLLHDPRFAGGGYRERENIARKRRRWAAKFAKMDRRERQAVATALVECDRAAVEMAMRSAPANAAVPDPKTPLGKNK